jgi:hypothetical protein
VALTTLLVINLDSPRSPDLVFCPLQKQWVAKSVPAPVRGHALLPEICAGTAEKTNFLSKLALNPNIIKSGGETTAADLFFSFRAKGDRAFAGRGDLPGAPNTPTASVVKAQNYVCTARFDLVTGGVNIAPIKRPSRSSAYDLKLPFPAIQSYELESNELSINPRGPPVSL